MKKLFAIALTLLATESSAAVVNIVEEVGSDVVFTYSGTLDVTGFMARSTEVRENKTIRDYGGEGLFYSRTGSQDYLSFDNSALASDVFGTTNDFNLAGTTSGDSFGFFGYGLIVPVGFSGGAISGSLTLTNQSFASLGLTTGTYMVTLPNDTITTQIGPSEVPLPAGFVLLTSAIGALGLRRRMRR